MRNVSNRSCADQTHILYSETFFSQKSCRLCDNAEKCGGATEASHDNMAHASCMLDKATRSLARARRHRNM